MKNREIKLAFSHMGAHKILLTGNLFVIFIATLFEGIGISMLVPILQSISNETSANVFIQTFKNLFAFMGIEYGFLPLVIVFAMIMIVKYFIVGFQQHLARVMSSTMTFELRKKAFRNLMNVSLKLYYETRPGDLVSTTWVSTGNAGGLIEYVFMFIKGLVFTIAYICLNCMISIPLTIITMLLAFVSYLFIIPRFRKVYSQGSEEKFLTDETNSFIHDATSGIKILKAFNNEKYHVGIFDNLLKKYRKIQIKIMFNKIMASFMLEPFAFALIIVMLIVAVKMLNIPLVSLIVFLFIFSQIIPKMKLINNNYMQINELFPHFSKVQDLIDTQNKDYIEDGTKNITSFSDIIQFRNIEFSYPESKSCVLDRITFDICKNQVVALVGASGGGKTTLVDLILRYHDPQKGEILVDGTDLKQIKIGSWLKLLAIVDQDPYLFNDTIYNNILYGNLSAEREDVLAASKMSYAHDFIMQLPDQYDTVAGNRGIKLSGGQRQRLSLARALVRDPEILILDEATSSLDSESEHLIQKSINSLQKKKTIIIIAHRLSTINKADTIVVLEKGRIVESGNHDELIKKHGRYEEFIRIQRKSS